MKNSNMVEASLANKELERLEKYLNRGRPLADVPLEELQVRWVALVRSWAEDILGSDTREREDIEAEMRYRKAEPPADLVKDAIDALSRKSKEVTDDLMRHPTRLQKAERELADQIAEFQTTAKAKKN